ncbi:MAG: rhodanese-like domain-containing protein [Candidatus Krumholzibacteriia bacterium]
MILRKTWLVLLLVALIAMWGCSDDDDGPTVPKQTAFEHLAEVVGALINDNTLTPGVIGVDQFYTLWQADPDNYAIIDFRSRADYDAGHIPGAYHSTLPTLLSDLQTTIPTGREYIVVCYTGQTVGHAQVAMQLMGYGPVRSIKWGMSAWSSSVTNWNTGIGNTLATAEVTNNNADLVEHDFPVLTGSVSTIVETRVAAMLAGDFKRVGYASIRDNLDDYFVVDYHSASVYLGQDAASGVPGHIPGSYQFTPYQTLGLDQWLKYLPTDKQIVLYCWTGTGSSHLAAYLNMLGYDAYSLLYGVNNLFHDQLNDGYANKWNPATMARNYPLEATPAL